MLHSRISRRLTICFLGVTLVSLSFLGVYLLHFFYEDNMEKQTWELERNARLVEIFLAGSLRNRSFSAQAAEAVEECSEEMEGAGLRVTVLSSSGQVLADSAGAAERMDNHGQRPEIQEAMRSQQGAAVRYSSTLAENMLYVAVPVFDEDDQLVGIIRTATSLAPIEASFARTRAAVLLAIFFAALLGLVVSLFLAQRQIRPIRQMTEAALSISHGDLARRLYIHTGDELEILAQTINRLTDSLSRKINEVETALHKQELILENMDNGVLLLDGEGRMSTANKQAKELFQLGSAQLGGSSIQALGSAQLSILARESADGEKTQTVSLELATASGPRTFLVFFAPFREKADKFVLCVFHDISLMQEMSRRQTEFVANAAHELATPLTAISGFAETLLEDDFHDAVQSQGFVRTIYQEAQRMVRLVEELLQLARLEKSEFRHQLVWEMVNVQDFPTRIKEKLAVQLTKKTQQMFLSEPAEPLYIKGRQELLFQLVLNLAENASKYTQENGQIWLSCSQAADGIVFTVRDNGIGIAETDLPFIFDRFYRADKARARASGGNGLGLCLVHFLVELFAGEIAVQSKLGEGTTFTLRFPDAADVPCGCVPPFPDK